MPGLHTAQSNRGLATPTVPRDRDLRSEDQSSCVSFPLACADAVQHIPPAKCRVFPCVEDLRRACTPADAGQDEIQQEYRGTVIFMLYPSVLGTTSGQIPAPCGLRGLLRMTDRPRFF